MSGSPVLNGPQTEAMLEVLVDAQRLGFLGQGPVDRHIEHAMGFADAWQRARPGLCPVSIADLGSGGGVPGLVLAVATGANVVLIDAKSRRTDWLAEASWRLDVAGRVRVLNRPVQEVGRNSTWRSSCEVVVARGFAAPAPTAECAAGIVARGGLVVVSEPPEANTRWDGLVASPLGFSEVVPVATPVGHYAVLRAGGEPLEERLPRTWAAQKKRPLW